MQIVGDVKDYKMKDNMVVVGILMVVVMYAFSIGAFSEKDCSLDAKNVCESYNLTYQKGTKRYLGDWAGEGIAYCVNGSELFKYDVYCD